MMEISIDIIERSFRDYVVKKHILECSEVVFHKCAFFDPLESMEKDTIYLCQNLEQLDPQALPIHCNLVFAGPMKDSALEPLIHVNYIVIVGIPTFKLFNNLLEIFYKYETFDNEFTALIQKRCSYQELVDLGTRVVEMPMCMINLNYQPIAMSKVDVPDDRLWEAMQNGYGLSYYDFIQRCEFKTEEMSKNGIAQRSMWSELAGNYLCVNILYSTGRAVGSIGMHKWYEKNKPFERATMQLFDYVVKRVSQRIERGRTFPKAGTPPRICC